MKAIKSVNQSYSLRSPVPSVSPSLGLVCVIMACILLGEKAHAQEVRSADDIAFNVALSDANAMPFEIYGGAVSVNGHWAMVGAESNSDVVSNAGAVFVYQYAGGAWTEVDELNANDASNFGLFGGAVSLWGNTAMIGARGDDANTGAVYVFEWSGTAWLQVDKLTASDAAAGDQFGQSVSLDGDRLLVGSPRDDDASFNSGTAYVFEHNGSGWVEVDKLGPDGVVFEEFFGFSVSLDGDRALVGAYNSTNPSTARAGAAYVFHFDGLDWNQSGKFHASDGLANDLFGYSVSISGNRVLVGAHGDDVNTGAVYAYSYNGASWGSELKLTAADAEMEDAFGLSVDLLGNRALIGAYRSDNLSDVDTGAAYVFEFDGLAWNEVNKLFNNAAVNNNFMGRAVSLTNSWLFIGADGFNGNRGEVRVYLDDPVYVDGFDAQ